MPNETAPRESRHQLSTSTGQIHTHSLFNTHTHTHVAWTSRAATATAPEQEQETRNRNALKLRTRAQKGSHLQRNVSLSPESPTVIYFLLPSTLSVLTLSLQSCKAAGNTTRFICCAPPTPPNPLAWCILIEGYIHARTFAKQCNSNYHAVWSVSAVSKQIKMSGLTEEVRASENEQIHERAAREGESV